MRASHVPTDPSIHEVPYLEVGTRTRAVTTNVRHEFRAIKSLFFPRWDRANRWRISTRSRRGVHGYCDRIRKVIEVAVAPSDPDERDLLLIHEICHAVTSGSHGKAWQARMGRAAERAGSFGRDRLAHRLREEVAAYREAGDWRTEMYLMVEGWLETQPDLTLAQVKRAIAAECGLLYSEVATKLKRLKKVFLLSRRDALAARERRSDAERATA